MVESLRGLRRPVVVAAFEGWNDAGDAATEVINHLSESYPTELIWEMDGEDFYDFQVTRPRVRLDGEDREVVWPSVQINVCRLPNRDLVLINGPEPNLRWRQFTTDLVSALRSVQPELVIFLGAMLTDSPHSRPLPVSVSSNDADLASRLGVETSNYEGPTGIIGVVADAAQRAGMRVVTMWASVPHYVAAPPNPKATLSLLAHLEDLLDTVLDQAELPELAKAWERGVNELASEDPEIAEYIESLEEQQDANELPQATGDSIAAEFQRYLRRRDQDQ